MDNAHISQSHGPSLPMLAIAGQDLQQLYLRWLVEPSTEQLVVDMLADAKAGKDVLAPYAARAAAAAASHSGHSHGSLGTAGLSSPGGRAGAAGAGGSGSSYGFGRIVLSGASPLKTGSGALSPGGPIVRVEAGGTALPSPGAAAGVGGSLSPGQAPIGGAGAVSTPTRTPSGALLSPPQGQRSTPPMSPHHGGYTVSSLSPLTSAAGGAPPGGGGRAPPLSPTRAASRAGASGTSSPGPGSPRHFTFAATGAAGSSISGGVGSPIASGSAAAGPLSPHAADDAFPFAAAAATAPTAGGASGGSGSGGGTIVPPLAVGFLSDVTGVSPAGGGRLVGRAGGSPVLTVLPPPASLSPLHSPGAPVFVGSFGSPPQTERSSDLRSERSPLSPTASAGGIALAAVAAHQAQAHAVAAAAALGGGGGGLSRSTSGFSADAPSQQQQYHLPAGALSPTLVPKAAGSGAGEPHSRFSASPLSVDEVISPPLGALMSSSPAAAVTTSLGALSLLQQQTGGGAPAGARNLEAELWAAANAVVASASAGGSGSASGDSTAENSATAEAAAAARAAALGSQRRRRVEGDWGADSDAADSSSAGRSGSSILRLSGKTPSSTSSSSSYSGTAAASAAQSPSASPSLVAAATSASLHQPDTLSLDADDSSSGSNAYYVSPQVGPQPTPSSSGPEARPTLLIEPLSLAPSYASSASSTPQLTATAAASGAPDLVLGPAVQQVSGSGSATSTPRRVGEGGPLAQITAQSPAAGAGAAPSAPTATSTSSSSIPTFWSKGTGYSRVTPPSSAAAVTRAVATRQPHASAPGRVVCRPPMPGAVRTHPVATGPSALPGESLREKLPAILELFRRGSATAAAAAASAAANGLAVQPHPVTPPPPVVYARAPPGDAASALSPAPGARVGVRIAGVEVSWDDAHASLPVEQFAAVAKTLCGFPSFFAAPLFRRLRAQFCGGSAGNVGVLPLVTAGTPDAVVGPAGAGLLASPGSPAATGGRPSTVSGGDWDAILPWSLPESPASSDDPSDRDVAGTIPLIAFLTYWAAEMTPHDHPSRFFRLVKRRSESSGIRPVDFMPLLEELLAFHPGLAFLESTPEFQEKYARTVVARVYYGLDPAGRRLIDLRSLRRSNLLAAFHAVDVEEDINAVTEYFSYEHFYVLYCKFWELDSDHDFLLSRQDCNRLTDVTHVLLDRVFAQAGRPFTSGRPDRMAYEDFVCFFMSEEDKTNESSLRYWFGVADVDGDGMLSPGDLRYFYREQESRMRSYGMEAIAFPDLMCQMTDLLRPRAPAGGEPPGDFFSGGGLTIEHFLHPDRLRVAGVLFSALWNLGKLQAFEARDPYTWKAELNGPPHPNAWSRFAAAEYVRLASEEEEAANAAGGGGASSVGAAAISALDGLGGGGDPFLSGGYSDGDGDAFDNVFSVNSGGKGGNANGSGGKGGGNGASGNGSKGGNGRKR